MIADIRHLTSVPAVDPTAAIADALEDLARNIRSGTAPFIANRCIVVLAGGPPGGDSADLGVACMGGEKSLLTDLGMLEMAKIELIDGARS